MGEGGRDEFTDPGGDQALRRPPMIPQDPIEIPREVLRNHLADLDQVCDFVTKLGALEIESLIDGPVRYLQDRLFANLPEG